MTCKNLSRRCSLCFLLIASAFQVLSAAQEVSLRSPTNAIAGAATSITTSGEGSATFYLIGPATAMKGEVQLGQEISLSAKDTQSAGRYIAVLCASTCVSADFFVAPAKPSSFMLLAHPSRVPVGEAEAISGVALRFDDFHNLVLTPATVNFQVMTKGAPPLSHEVQMRNGIAWFRTNSGKTAGPLQLTASLDGLSARRVVQQVASDPCNLRIKGQRTEHGILVETDPVRDCTGNPVPDGTIVTFTARNGSEISTVDAPVKQDVARARIIASGPTVVSAASGVVMGNELHVDGR
jgi:hypothetical protein